MIREWIKEHSPQLVVLGIGTAISFVVGLAITGDYSNAFGFAHRR